MTEEPTVVVALPGGRGTRRLSLVVVCALTECGPAPGSVIELAQYQPVPQYRAFPEYRPVPQYPGVPPYRPTPQAPQYQPMPQYRPTLQAPRAPQYEPGPYDNYNHGNGP
jgi:hypothetical protein